MQPSAVGARCEVGEGGSTGSSSREYSEGRGPRRVVRLNARPRAPPPSELDWHWEAWLRRGSAVGESVRCALGPGRSAGSAVGESVYAMFRSRSLCLVLTYSVTLYENHTYHRRIKRHR